MWQWLSNLFQNVGASRLQPKPPHLQAVAVHNSTNFGDNARVAEHETMYQQSAWVYVAVNRIAEAAALVPLRVLRVEGDKRVEIVRHPLEVLLDNPNPVTSRFELFEQTIGFLELTGNAYWFIVGDARGRPAQIWTLRPDRVTIVPHPQHYVAGYIYEIDGQRIPLEAVEVVHFKRWHPANDYYGLSALEAARIAVDSDRAMARWNKNTFGQDNGVPAGIVNIKEFISDSDFERIKREWRGSYGNAQRKTAFLRGGAVEWQNIGLSHTDLDFLQGRKAHREEILNIFGLPVGLVAENATEANAKVAERLFIERTLYPKLVRLAQKITQELLPFYPGEHTALFDDIRPTDVQARLDEIRTAQSILSINEIRERYYEMPPVVWGAMPVNMQPSVAVHDNPPNGNVPNKNTPKEDVSDNQPEPEEQKTKSALDELTQWERFAVNRLGKGESRPFEVNAVPDELAFEVSAGLLFAQDKDSIKSVFTSAREELMKGVGA
jgi:HK97 family phage portal protein